MILQIPNDYRPLVTIIESNLFIAGYGVPFESEISKTGVFNLILKDDVFSIQVVDSFQEVSDSIQLKYAFGQPNTLKLDLMNLHFPIAIIGAANDTGGLSDRWIDGDSHNIQYYATPTNWSEFVKIHLSWVLTLLLLEYPFEDALLLANTLSLSNVSRETWSSIISAPIASVSLNDIFKSQPLVSLKKVKDTTQMDKNIGLYPVVDNSKTIKSLLELNVKTIQLRIKNEAYSAHDLENEIIRAVQLGKEYEAQVFINDHWDLAIKHNAFGVHLGQEDLSTVDLRLLNESGLALGISTHSYYELIRAIAVKPTYIALGHVFPTTTKIMKSSPQGIQKLQSYQYLISKLDNNIPTVAIGGINLSNIEQVLSTSIDGVAVVRAISESQSLDNTLNKFWAAFDESKYRTRTINDK